MRAEEGDESVQDYAAEGQQALSRIKSSRRGGLGRIAHRFAQLWKGEHRSRDDG
ncbi:hypothetical protein [Mycobacterium angelicum]|uniref:hypothetical protein n=1 Tax=Mycobacterium angelicum TaxID=470074 RepID=UPI00147438A8|nr:hypothetical protein [Mycobacterium angelicum]MCV7199857.1 hypothetical protein [Mycobacterium angelicum]